MAPRTVAAALAGEALFWRLSQLRSQPGRSGPVIRGRIRAASRRSRSRSGGCSNLACFSSQPARGCRDQRAGPLFIITRPAASPHPAGAALSSLARSNSLSLARSLFSLSRALSLSSRPHHNASTRRRPQARQSSTAVPWAWTVATVLATGLAWAAALPPPAVTEALVAVSSGVRCRRRRPAKAEAVPARPSHRRRCARADAVVAHVEQWYPHCCWPWALRRVEVGLPPPPPPPLQLALAEPAAAARERRHRQVAAWAEPAGCLRIDERVHTQTSRQRITRACRHTAAQHGDR